MFVFFVGGCTYEEAHAAEMFNRADNGVKLFVGGTTIHNSKRFDVLTTIVNFSFLDDLMYVSAISARP